MKVETFRCDECGHLKEQTNHWWAVTVLSAPPAAVIEPLDEFSKKHDKWADPMLSLCGRECVQKVVERFMSQTTQ